MRTLRNKELEAAGWKVGSAAEFLGLDAAEQAMVELRLGLGKSLREKRAQSGLTQTQLARRIGSSQSRVAKMEASDASVSLDLMIRALLALQAKPSEITRAIHRAGR